MLPFIGVNTASNTRVSPPIMAKRTTKMAFSEELARQSGLTGTPSTSFPAFISKYYRNSDKAIVLINDAIKGRAYYGVAFKDLMAHSNLDKLVIEGDEFNNVSTEIHVYQLD